MTLCTHVVILLGEGKIYSSPPSSGRVTASEHSYTVLISATNKVTTSLFCFCWLSGRKSIRPVDSSAPKCLLLEIGPNLETGVIPENWLIKRKHRQ